MKINEIFYSIQGEGKNTGVPMVFIRLAGCNLRCGFCDTTYAFDSGEDMAEPEIVGQVKKHNAKWVCITGGEPLLQDLSVLTDNLKREGFLIQVETNGTVRQDIVCDWLTVSPKGQQEPDTVMLERADEVKIVIDSSGALDKAREFEKWGVYHSVQPVDNRPNLMRRCMEFVKANPSWRLSVQLHKLLDID